MPQMPPIDPENAGDAAGHLFTVSQQLFGVTPNNVKVMAQSPAALRGYVALTEALGGSEMPAFARSAVGLLVAQEHGCDYCLSAHSFLGSRLAGMTEGELSDARFGSADDPKCAAILAFAAALIRRRGAVTDDELCTAQAELAPTELVDVIAHVALAIFDNYLVLAGRVDIDWPLVRHTDHAHDTKETE
ncbi:carboxymuconolactone decarboxylase family protein [Nocardia sp. NPDC004168]|uniref:carboxymuconolactone decarboxylase family protein n=1 Tax=Nocardia sp. NPDC004168 TaxID=3154452 RepID=UPI0033B28DDF